MYRLISILFILAIGCMGAFAQTDRSHIRSGNRHFRTGAVESAEIEYSKALTKKDNNPQALYNLACAYMQQNKDSLAVTYFDKAANIETSKFRKSMSYHNMGVICQKHQMYAEAINAYKQSLRLNPDDNETRYNLELCRHMLKNQPQQQKQQQQQNKEEKKQEKQEKQEKPQPKEQMSKDNAEQLLQAAMQEEKHTQQKLQKAKSQPQRKNIQKNW